MIYVFICNSIVVCLFGVILSASFCDINWTKKMRWALAGFVVLLLLLQGGLYLGAGGEFVRSLYPLIVHVPMIIVLSIFSKKGIWSFVAVLTSYLCCQLRRWIALLAVAVIDGSMFQQDVIEIVITIPLLIILLKYVAPSVRYISHSTRVEQIGIAAVPLLAYGFDYGARIYTNWLSSGTPVVVEFMFFICSGFYLISVMHSSKAEKKQNEMQHTQEYLNLQIEQSLRQLEGLRKAQEKAKIYRHDLRHHLLYISSCIENEQLNRAQEYIQEICNEIETSKVKVYCENEAVNLILSAYALKAEEKAIPMRIKAAISSQIAITESDLCVLLSNALENALHACANLKDNDLVPQIEISAFEKNKKIFIEVINTCDEEIAFEEGIPVSKKTGHGIGVRSICAIVEKYEGIHTFRMNENQLCLRVSL